MKRQSLCAMVLVVLMVVLVCTLCACVSNNPVGPRMTQDASKVSYENPSPVTLTISDGDKIGSATGTGPARFTSITNGKLQTLQTGSVPRDMFIELRPDGTKQFNLSTGTDIRAKGFKWDPVTGALSLDEFSTVTSEPLRAANEGLDRFIEIVRVLTPAQRDVLISQFEAQRDAATGIAKAGFQAVIDAMKGIP